MNSEVLDTYPKYDNYKDSGVDWLGKIPEEWDLVPAFKFISENKIKNTGLVEDIVLSLSFGQIVIKPKEKLTGLVPESFEGYQIVKPNNIIIRCTDLQNDKNSLRIGLVKNDGIITSAYLGLKVSDEYSPKYLFYYLYSLDTSKAIYKMGTGLRQNLSFNDFKRFSLPNISLEYQITVAKFLDQKTLQIDEAIELKKKQIEKLNEYKQITIQNAVTKGLDANAKMKDSGIAWMGDIPEHWNIKKSKFLFEFSKGLTITKDNLQDSGVLCVNYGEIHSKYGFELRPNEHELKYVDTSYIDSNPRALLNNGDFVFADTSEDIEGSGNFTYINGTASIFAGYHTVIAKPTIEFNSRFVAYIFDSISYRSQIRHRVKGVKVYSITQSMLKNTFIWLPPKQEQENIVNYLDKILFKVTQANDAYKTEIERLKEYKTILINQAVTGKIKVS